MITNLWRKLVNVVERASLGDILGLISLVLTTTGVMYAYINYFPDLSSRVKTLEQKTQNLPDRLDSVQFDIRLLKTIMSDYQTVKLEQAKLQGRVEEISRRQQK